MHSQWVGVRRARTVSVWGSVSSTVEFRYRVTQILTDKFWAVLYKVKHIPSGCSDGPIMPSPEIGITSGYDMEHCNSNKYQNLYKPQVQFNYLNANLTYGPGYEMSGPSPMLYVPQLVLSISAKPATNSNPVGLLHHARFHQPRQANLSPPRLHSSKVKEGGAQCCRVGQREPVCRG